MDLLPAAPRPRSTEWWKRLGTGATGAAVCTVAALVCLVATPRGLAAQSLVLALFAAFFAYVGVATALESRRVLWLMRHGVETIATVRREDRWLVPDVWHCLFHVDGRTFECVASDKPLRLGGTVRVLYDPRFPTSCLLLTPDLLPAAAVERVTAARSLPGRMASTWLPNHNPVTAIGIGGALALLAIATGMGALGALLGAGAVVTFGVALRRWAFARLLWHRGVEARALRLPDALVSRSGAGILRYRYVVDGVHAHGFRVIGPSDEPMADDAGLVILVDPADARRSRLVLADEWVRPHS